MAVDPVPSRYPALIPMAALEGCGEAVEFYKTLFGAREALKMSAPDGSVAHVELLIGDSMLMLGEAMPQQGFPPTSLRLSLYVPDCDEVFKRALAAGATERSAPADKFYGDRSGTFVDPWGLEWTVMTHVKDMTEEEMQQAMQALYA